MNQRRSNSILATALLAAAVLAGAVTGVARGAEKEAPPPWVLWPYRVQILVAVGEGSLIPAHFQDEMPDELRTRLPPVVGGMWKLAVMAAPAELKRRLLSDIDSVERDSLPAVDEFDKVILLAAVTDGGRLALRARECDMATGIWNATVTVSAGQSEYAAHAAVRAVLTAFAPLARIEVSDGQTATLRLRASGLAPDGAAVMFAGDAAFRPVLVESNAAGTITRGKAALIERTYLTVTNAKGQVVECKVQTGLQGEVIPAYHPLRQRLALGVSRSSSSTRLRIVSRDNDAAPMEGITVAAEDEPPVVIGASDRRGEVLVPPGDRAVRTIVVRQGDEVLARLPLVPGLDRELTVRVNYDLRLVELEAIVARLADDLIDATARRAVLSARIAAAEAAPSSADLPRLRQQLAAAGNIEPLLARLDRLQQSVQSTAPLTRRRLEDKLAELRRGIDRLKSLPAAK